MPFLLLLSLFSTQILAKDEFASDNLKGMLEDSLGYIWGYGIEGLIRYDGHKRLVVGRYGKIEKPFSNIYRAIRHKDNFIFVSPKEGVIEFSPADFSHKVLYSTNLLTDVTNLEVRKDGLLITEFDTQHLLNHDATLTSHPLSFAYVYDVCSIKSGQQFLLAKDTRGKLVLAQYSLATETSRMLLDKTIRAIHCFDTEVLVATKNDTYLLDAKGDIKQQLANNYIRIYASRNKLFGLEKKKYRLFEFQYKQSHIEEVRLDYSIDNFNGIQEGLFVSEQGVVLISNIEQRQYKYTPNALIHEPIDKNIQASVLHQDDGRLYVGSAFKGLFTFSDGKLTPLTKVNKALLSQTDGNFARRAMWLTSDNDFLYYASFAGAYRIDKTSHQVERLATTLPSQFFYRIVLTEQYIILPSVQSGLVILDRKTGVLIRTQASEVDGQKIGNLYGLKQVAPNLLWFTGEKGIFSLTLDTLEFEKVYLQDDFISDNIAVVNNKYYVATYGQGLLVFNKQNELINQLYPGTHLLNLTLIDDELWVSANQGLFKVSPKTENILQMPGSVKLGFKSKVVEFDDKLFVSGPQGMYSISKKHQSSFQPKVVISETKLDGTTHVGMSSFELGQEHLSVEFSLASLDYRHPEAHKFAYRLNQGEWINLSSNTLSLPRLEPGEYELEFKGTNSEGIWSPHHTFAQVSVIPPWYQSNSIKLLVFVSIVLVLGLILLVLGLKAKASEHLRSVLKTELWQKGQSAKEVQQHLIRIRQLALEDNETSLNDIVETCDLALGATDAHMQKQRHKHLMGRSLEEALYFLQSYFQQDLRAKLEVSFELDESILPERVAEDIYRASYETCSTLILNGYTRLSLNLQLRQYKIWLLIKTQHASKIASFSNKSDLGLFILKNICESHNGQLDISINQGKQGYIALALPLQQNHSAPLSSGVSP